MNSAKSIFQKFAVLSISLVLTSSYVISVSLPDMKKTFAGMSTSSVELLSTLPAFTVMIFVLISGWMTEKIGNKKTVALGLIIVGLAGIVPVFATSYGVIFASRLVLGAGLGLFNSLAVSMIGFLYEGKTKASLMGLRSAFENLGQSFLIFVAGFLLTISWHATFWVYALAFVILPIFYFGVPDTRRDVEVKEKGKADVHQHINIKVIGLAVFFFFLVMIHIAIIVHLPFVVTENGFGTAAQAGVITSSMTILGVIAAIFYGQIYDVLRQYIIPIGMVCLAIGVLIMGLANGYVMTFAGALVFGVAYPLIAADMFNKVSTVSSPNSETLTASVMLIGTNCGALLAPYGVAGLSALIGDSVGNRMFVLLGAILIAVTIGAFVIALRSRKAEKKAVEQ